MIARMNGKPSHIGIVEVEVAESRAIGEGRKIGRRAPVGADDGGVAANRQRDVAANATGFSSKAPIPHPIVSITWVLTRSIVAASISS